jgi:hypothetical protein
MAPSSIQAVIVGPHSNSSLNKVSMHVSPFDLDVISLRAMHMCRLLFRFL